MDKWWTLDQKEYPGACYYILHGRRDPIWKAQFNINQKAENITI